MATKTKPAAKAAKPAAQPAKEQPAVQQTVGIKELAEDLGRTPKAVRASIRRIKGGAQVGRGGRYNFGTSKDSKEYKAMLKELTAAPKEDVTVEV